MTNREQNHCRFSIANRRLGRTVVFQSAIGNRQSTIRHGFTLVELLVVISIIALLLAILLPAISKAKALAVSIKCDNQVRQLAMFNLLYANDNNGCMISWGTNWTGSAWNNGWYDVAYSPFFMQDLLRFKIQTDLGKPGHILDCPSASPKESYWLYNAIPKNILEYGYTVYCGGGATPATGGPVWRKVGGVFLPAENIMFMDAGYYILSDSAASSVYWQLKDVARNGWVGDIVAYPHPGSSVENGSASASFVDGHAAHVTEASLRDRNFGKQ